jgi:hypothetical protein
MKSVFGFTKTRHVAYSVSAIAIVAMLAVTWVSTLNPVWLCRSPSTRQ